MSLIHSRRRRPRRLGGAFAAVMALAACSSGDGTSIDVDGSVTSTTASTSTSAPTTVAPGPTIQSPLGTADSETTSTIVESMPPVPVALGDVEVAQVRHLPRLEVAWSSTELTVPDDDRGAHLVFLDVVGDEFVAVGLGSWQPDDQQVYTWRSPDGETWTRSDAALPPGTWLQDVFVVGDGLIATGALGADGRHVAGVWRSDAGDSWLPVELRADGIDPEGLSFTGAAVNDAGIVIGARRDDYTPPGPVVFEFEGYHFAVNDATGTYEVTELGSGRLVVAGPMSDIHQWNEDGQAIWDFETGELLTVVPWEEWHSASESASPLPIPTPVETAADARQVVEWGGYRVVIEPEADRVEVTDVATGTIVTTSTLDAFHRGPAPTFVDTATGEVAVSFTWQAWDMSIQAGYEALYEPHVAHESDLLVLHSPDGERWTAVDVGRGVNTHLESVMSIGSEFQAVVVDHGGPTPARALHRSANGVDWTAIELDDEQFVGSVASGPSGTIGLSWDTSSPEGPTVATTVDGVTWTPLFTVGQQDDGRSASLQLVASGASGRAALATLHPVYTEDILTITVGSQTARFPHDDIAVEITDAFGDVVFVATNDQVERAAMGEAEPIMTFADGVSTFISPDGDPIMSITNDQVYDAWEDMGRQYQLGVERVMFVELDGRWHEAHLPAIERHWVDRLALGTDVILVGVSDSGEGEEGEAWPGDPPVVFVGRFDAADAQFAP